MSDMRLEKLFDQARAEYVEHVGKDLLTRHLHCFRDEASDDVYFDPPIRVRVLAGADDESDIARVCGDWVDPYWPVELVGEDSRVDGLCSLEVYGTSLSVLDGSKEPVKWVLA